MNKKINFIYILILIILYSIYELLSPTTYPILLLLTGNGRFNDWWLTLGGIVNYPEIVDGICTVPWVYAFLLIQMQKNFGTLQSHIIYLFISLIILFLSFKRLSLKFGKLSSFLIIFSYPIIFGFWRGNSDFIIYGLVLLCYFYGKESKYDLSIIYCGLAIAFKPYQVFILLVYKIKYIIKNIPIIIIGIGIIIYLIYIANNNFFTSTYKDIIECGKFYNDEYAIRDGGSLHNNSLWGLFKVWIYAFISDKNEAFEIIKHFSKYLEIWPILLVILFFIANYSTKLFQNDNEYFSSKFFILCLLIPILSPIVPDYRLFFINICLIITLTNNFVCKKTRNLFIVVLITILMPKEFYWFNLKDAWFTVNGIINSILMIGIYIIILMKGFTKNLNK